MLERLRVTDGFSLKFPLLAIDIVIDFLSTLVVPFCVKACFETRELVPLSYLNLRP